MLHIANTNFEFELENEKQNLTLRQAIEIHPMCLQLQFLPVLYANKGDGIVVTHLPSKSFMERYPRIEWAVLETQHIDFQECCSWGASRMVQDWARSQGLNYDIPRWDVVKKVNSKAYSFEIGPQLPGARLIWNDMELNEWLREMQGLRVLKTCFGLSGKGHFLLDESTPSESIKAFCQKEWSQNRPILAERWMKRVLDFSTQWFISKAGIIECLGTTYFETSSLGRYQATRVGEESKLFGDYISFVRDHQTIVKNALSNVVNEGFFGNLGVDAFVYRDDQNQLVLHPIVEINGRKTLSLIALLLQQSQYPNEMIRFSFSRENQRLSLLPMELDVERRKVTFPQQLIVEVLK